MKRTRSQHPARRRQGVLLVLVLLLGVLPPAAAADPPAQNPAGFDTSLRDELLEGRGDGDWRGVLLRAVEMDASWIGVVLGDLFRERDRYAEHAACVAYTAAFLADHPVNEERDVLLGHDVIARAYRDEGFVAAMRVHLTKGAGGWGRLLDQARGMLRDADARVRATGIWFLAREDADRRLEIVRALRERAAEEDPGLPAESLLAEEYLDAFAALLGYRFPSVANAVAELEARRGLDLATLILQLSLLKDRERPRDRQQAVDWGRRHVDLAVAARDPAALEEFLDPRRTNLREVRLYAVQKAPLLEPRPEPPWDHLLCVVLSFERDGEVVRSALDLLERFPFSATESVARELSACIVERLGRPEETTTRVRLAKVLGGLRGRESVLEALSFEPDGLENAVLAELVRALGTVRGARAEDVLSYWRRHQGDAPRDRMLRVAVADALGRPGLGETNAEGEAAGAALRAILSATGREDLPPARTPEVRQHALRSLGSHPSPETSGALYEAAVGTADAEAQVAIVVLRRSASAHLHAVEALGGVAAMEGLATPRRRGALQALGDLGESPDPAILQGARAAVRRVLGGNGPPEVLLDAATTAASLADAGALDPVLALWVAEPGPERLGALAGLALAVAGAGGSGDAALGAFLQRAAEAGHDALADDLARRLVAAHDRPALRVARARLLQARAARAERETEERRADLEEADAVLAAALDAPDGEARDEALHLRVEVLLARGDLAQDAAGRKERLLEAVLLAATATRPETASLGRTLLAALEGEPLGPLVTEEERLRLDAARQAFERLLGD